MNLSAVDAINRVNESVTVEMLVQRTKCCTGSRQVFLDSEASYRDPKNLGVVVTESGRAKLAEAGIDDPAAHFKGQASRPALFLVVPGLRRAVMLATYTCPLSRRIARGLQSLLNSARRSRRPRPRREQPAAAHRAKRVQQAT